MVLSEEGLRNKKEWEKAGYHLPEYDRERMRQETRENPFWIHFGAGNIFRAFQANAVQKLLNQKAITRGLIVAEGFDEEIIDKVNHTCDDYSILVTMHADGTLDKTVVGSVAESLKMNRSDRKDFERLRQIFQSDTLQMVSFTITEKGYDLCDGNGQYLPEVEADLKKGPAKTQSYMGKTTSLLYERFLKGKLPIAMVSMDNCSGNGEKLFKAIYTFVKKWVEEGLTEKEFLYYVSNSELVSFPCTMIDKITPRPDASVGAVLKQDGVEHTEITVTKKHTYVAPFVNAEACEYLVIEDSFPNGEPELEKAGFFFTNRDTVDRAEKMKVCTCLNPIHTALAVFGCILNYERMSEAVRDPDLNVLVREIGYQEGLPVVKDPVVLNPKEFLKTVLEVRIPNPYMPDSPKRIVTDTSQKLPIRFGETVKAYRDGGQRKPEELVGIELVFAGWLRYLMGTDDQGKPMELSPDPLLEVLTKLLSGGKPGVFVPDRENIKSLLKNEKIFGVDLYTVNMAEPVYQYFMDMCQGPGAVRNVLTKFTADIRKRGGFRE